MQDSCPFQQLIIEYDTDLSVCRSSLHSVIRFKIPETSTINIPNDSWGPGFGRHTDVDRDDKHNSTSAGRRMETMQHKFSLYCCSVALRKKRLRTL